MNFTKEQIQQQLNNCLIGHCSNGHLDLAELLINKAGVDVNARDDMTDETALMGACQGGHVMMVSYLLERGADVNAKQHCRHWQGVTALMKASSVGNEEIVKILLENGADVHMMNSTGKTALIVAQIKEHTTIVELIKNHIYRIICLVIKKGLTQKGNKPLLRYAHREIINHIASFF